MSPFEIVTIITILIIIALAALNGYYYLYYSKKRTPFTVSRSPYKKLLQKANIVLLIGLGAIFGYVFVFPTNVQASSLKDGEIWSDYSKPFEITFNKPVNKSKIDYNFSKDIKGEWKFEKASRLDFFNIKLVFYPEESLLPADKITFNAQFDSIVPIIQKSTKIEFSSGNPTPVVRINDEIQGKQNIRPDQSIDIEIADANPNSYILESELKQGLVFTQVKSEDYKIKLNHSVPFTNGESYDVKLFITPVTYNLKTNEIVNKGVRESAGEVKFQIATTPVIKEVNPKGENVLASETVQINFDQEMDKVSVESGIKFEPTVDVSFEWNDDFSELNLKPKSMLQKETTYTLSLSDRIKSKFGAELVQNLSPQAMNVDLSTQAAEALAIEPKDSFSSKYSFKTIGSVGVASTNPGAGTNGVNTSANITIGFNQNVDKESAESKFSISPDVVGKFGWDGNTLVFDPNSVLGFSQKYTVSLAAGVKSVDGIDLKSSYTFSFTTKSNKVILNVPYIAQGPQNACNVTAAAMVLRFKGIGNVNPMDVFGRLASQNSPEYYLGNGTASDYPAGNEVWGDPDAAYVGNIYGTSGGDGSIGYGVYWGPIASAINSYKPGSAEVKNGWNLSGVLQEIDNGNPSIVWWQNGAATPTRLSWKTASGKTVTGINGMHSEVVVGYEGSPDNPTYIYLNDPWNRWGGYHKMTASYFNNLWTNTFNRSAVVVR